MTFTVIIVFFSLPGPKNITKIWSLLFQVIHKHSIFTQRRIFMKLHKDMTHLVLEKPSHGKEVSSNHIKEFF